MYDRTLCEGRIFEKVGLYEELTSIGNCLVEVGLILHSGEA